MYKKFEYELKERTKYNPATFTVTVEAKDEVASMGVLEGQYPMHRYELLSIGYVDSNGEGKKITAQDVLAEIETMNDSEE